MVLGESKDEDNGWRGVGRHLRDVILDLAALLVLIFLDNKFETPSWGSALATRLFHGI